MRRNVKVLLLLLLLPCIGYSQKQIGLGTSNWNTSQSIFINPAMAANPDVKLVIDIASINFGVDNDAATLHSGAILSNYFGNEKTPLRNMYDFSSKTNINMMAPYAEVHGPGILFTVGKSSFGINTRLRAMSQVSNFNGDLYRSIADQKFTDGTMDYDMKSKGASWNANVWSDIGLTYATTIFDNGTHRLKGGINLHFLRGVGYMNAKVTNLDAHYYSGRDSLRITNSDLSFSSNMLKSGEDVSNSITGGQLLSRIFGGGAGTGFGTDFGFIYEYNDNTYGSNSYLIRTSVSVTDIGSMNYTTGNKTVRLSGNGFMYGRDLDTKLSNYSDLQNYAEGRGIMIDTSVGKTKMTLPTTMIVGMDLHYSEHGFLNVTYVANLRGQATQGNNYYSQITFTPRYDSKLLGLGLPVTVNSLSGKVKVGMFCRMGGFYLGSDDMLGLKSNSQNGINVYCGGSIPLYKRYRIRRF